MHTGVTLVFQNLDRALPDAAAFAAEKELALRAEPAGFDSVWTPEHHFTSYGMTPDVPQFLSWLAGRTERINLGTMVQVLPWQDPVRTAENFILLDHLSEGRSILGVGRGLGRVEFDGFRLDMGQSRRLFTEYSEAILTGLESGVISHDGELYKQPAMDLRPSPYATFRGRTFASAVSPASMDLMASMGVGLMVIAQKPWPKAEEEMRAYRQRYLELNGAEAPKPIICVFTGVGETEAEARQMREVYLRRYAESTVEHYEFDNIGFAEIEGYEYYAGMARNIAKHGLDGFCDFLADLQVWGTPDQVVERVLEYTERLDAGGVLLAPSFGGMSPEVAARNFDLIARDVLPRLQAHDVGGDLGVRHGAPIGAHA
ncbi:luciferase [Gordonia spumicola]|uniref:Luciferase n=1 Tax=Gordonia spumicola TaxID=589161 RepID=A0A7I9V8D7_9ACTN|nr:LLM class flavin-dependent oxidoreductase [Gordonia spumicola]GEE01656.1 luciferase [Gordonia spumicola]